MVPNAEDLGVAHGDDIILIFNTPFRSGQNGLIDDEIIMQQKLLDLYESFLRNEYDFSFKFISRSAIDGF